MAAKVAGIEFTAEELDWIAAHPIVSVGADTSFPPFEYLNEDGQVVGLSIAYLDLISEDTGIKFDVQSSEHWQDFLPKVENGEMLLLSGAVETARRKETLNFSRPYAVFPPVIVTRDDAHFVGSLRNLTGENVAVVEGFFEEDILRKDYPKLKLKTYKTRREALYAVSTGEAYAYIGNLAIVSYLIRSENFNNIQIAAPTPFTRIGLSMASADPVLIGIINKVLNNVTPSKQNELEQQWIAVRYQEVDYIVFGKLGIAILAVIAIGIAWICSLKIQVKRRLKSEEELSRAKKLAEEAKSRAEEANSRKSEFLGIAAHDLKNPLGSIRGLSEVLIEDIDATELPKEKHADWADILKTIRDAADHMLELVKELLNVESLESGQEINDRESVDLTLVLKDVVDFNKHAAVKKEIKLTHVAPDYPLVTQGDFGRIREILDNLINNAVKYTKRGGEVRVELDFNENNGMFLVAVSDEGPGLTEKDMQKLFGRFSRGSATPTGGETSTGLGLSIVKLMIEELGGRTWAENRKSTKGSIFYAEFPQSQPDSV